MVHVSELGLISTFWNPYEEKPSRTRHFFVCLFCLLFCAFPAGTRRLCNVRLTLDMTSDRRCILVENENRVDGNIWRQFDVDLTLDLWLHNLKTTKSQRQLTSVLDINLTLTLDVGFTLDFGHPTSQPKFNQISTSYDVVCLFCACWIILYVLDDSRENECTQIWIYLWILARVLIFGVTSQEMTTTSNSFSPSSL